MNDTDTILETISCYVVIVHTFSNGDGALSFSSPEYKEMSGELSQKTNAARCMFGIHNCPHSKETRFAHTFLSSPPVLPSPAVSLCI